MTISFSLTKQDEMLLRDIAKLHGVSVSEYVRTAVIEHIEDEIDIQTYLTAIEELQSDSHTYTMEEAKDLIEL